MNRTYKKKVYTIECGNILEDGDYEMTNECSYLLKGQYEKMLKNILNSVVGNNSQNGYYIECYYDEENLTHEDIEYIKEYHTIELGAKKATLIQEFICKNYNKGE